MDPEFLLIIVSGVYRNSDITYSVVRISVTFQSAMLLIEIKIAFILCHYYLALDQKAY